MFIEIQISINNNTKEFLFIAFPDLCFTYSGYLAKENGFKLSDETPTYIEVKPHPIPFPYDIFPPGIKLYPLICSNELNLSY